MRKKTCTYYLLPVIIPGLLFFVLCEKKSEQKKFVEAESLETQISLPPMNWEKVIQVQVETHSEKPNQEVLTQIIQENLITSFQSSKSLLFVSETNEQIQPDYLLKSKVDWDQNNIKVRFQLMDSTSQESLWEKTYDEKLVSILSVTENAASYVQEQLDGEKSVQRANETGVAKEVLAQYMAGKSSLAKQTRDENGLAIQHFKAAFRSDTTFTLALTGLAESYLQIHQMGWDQNVIWIRLAQEAVKKAIAMNEGLADAYIQLGNVLIAWGDFHQAEKQFRKAIELNQNLPDAWFGLGLVFSHFGLYDPCLTIYGHALSLKSNLDIAISQVMILIGKKKYGIARSNLDQLLMKNPSQLHLFSISALLYLYQDNLKKADKAIQQGLQSHLMKPFSHAVLAMIFAKQKKLDAALAELEFHVKPYADQDPSLSTAVAAVYSLIGQNGQAVHWLEKAVSSGYHEYTWLINDPNLKNLQSDERFITLMEKLRTQWENHRKTYWLDKLVNSSS